MKFLNRHEKIYYHSNFCLIQVKKDKNGHLHPKFHPIQKKERNIHSFLPEFLKTVTLTHLWIKKDLKIVKKIF